MFSLCTLEPRKNLIRAVKTFIEFIKKNKINDMVFVLGGGHWDKFIGKLESEIKDLGKTEAMQRTSAHTIYDTLRQYGYLGRTIVISSHADLLQIFREETGAGIPIAPLSGAWSGISKLPNAYSAYWKSPLGSATLYDYSPLVGRKGLYWGAY